MSKINLTKYHIENRDDDVELIKRKDVWQYRTWKTDSDIDPSYKDWLSHNQ